MDQENNLQGTGFDGAGQNPFFFTPQQQQQFFLNQQIPGQTSQMIAGQRQPAVFSMQGAQQLFQAQLAQSQGVGQLGGAGQYSAGHDGFSHGVRQDMGAQGVSGTGSTQLGLLGVSAQGYPVQEHLMQQQRTQQQQLQSMQQRAVALSDNASSYMQPSAGNSASQRAPSSSIPTSYAFLAKQISHQNQIGVPNQKTGSQDALSQAIKSQMPQTPQSSAFKLPGQIYDFESSGLAQQHMSSTTRPISSQLQGGSLSGQGSQSQPQGASQQQQPQTNLATSFQQQISYAQQQQNSQTTGITSQLLNQFLTTQQQSAISSEPHQSVFTKMQANGQWPQTLGITTKTIGGPAQATPQSQPLTQNLQTNLSLHSVTNQSSQGRQHELSNHASQATYAQQAPSNAVSQGLPGNAFDGGHENLRGPSSQQQSQQQQVAQHMWQIQNQQKASDSVMQQMQQQQTDERTNAFNSQLGALGQSSAQANGSAALSGQPLSQAQYYDQPNFAQHQLRFEHVKQEQQPNNQSAMQQYHQSSHDHSQSNVAQLNQNTFQQLQAQSKQEPTLPYGSQGFPYGQGAKSSDTFATAQQLPPKMPQTPSQQPQQQFSVNQIARVMPSSREQTHQSHQGANDQREASFSKGAQNAMLNQYGQGLFNQSQSNGQNLTKDPNQSSIGGLGLHMSTQPPAGANDAFAQYQQHQQHQQLMQKQGGGGLPQQQSPYVNLGHNQKPFGFGANGQGTPYAQSTTVLAAKGQPNILPMNFQQQMASQVSQGGGNQTSIQHHMQSLAHQPLIGQHSLGGIGGSAPQMGSLQGSNPQNLLMQFGMQPDARVGSNYQQMGQPAKSEPVNQQHLLAAISNIGQTQQPGLANGASMGLPGSHGQNPMDFMHQPGQQDLSGLLDQVQPNLMQQTGNKPLDGLPYLPGNVASQMQQMQNQGSALNGVDPHLLDLQPGGQMGNPELNVSSIPSLSKMAEFCATRGNYQQAIEYYRQLITHDPNNGAAWTALGHCYLLTEDIHKAFTAYQHALYSVEDMNDPQLWYGIGILYERFESYDNAISALIGVLKMSPNFYQKSEVLYKLGTIFAKTNQIDQASKFFQNSILTSSFSVKKKVDTLIKIGLLYEEKKDFQQAKRSFEAALSLNNKNVRVYQHLAWCSFRHGNIESALKYIQKAGKRSKEKNVYSLYIKGRCMICLDNTQEAFDLISQAAQQLPTEAVFWTSLAVLLYYKRKINESFEHITLATSLKHELWEVWYNLGILYETCKQPEEALIAYDMVLSIDPKQPDAQKRILAIKQHKYTEEMNDSQNPVQLQMKHPTQCIPNTLTILRNYWKHNEQQQTTLQPVQPPQNGANSLVFPGATDSLNESNVNQHGIARLGESLNQAPGGPDQGDNGLSWLHQSHNNQQDQASLQKIFEQNQPNAAMMPLMQQSHEMGNHGGPDGHFGHQNHDSVQNQQQLLLQQQKLQAAKALDMLPQNQPHPLDSQQPSRQPQQLSHQQQQQQAYNGVLKQAAVETDKLKQINGMVGHSSSLQPPTQGHHPQLGQLQYHSQGQLHQHQNLQGGHSVDTGYQVHGVADGTSQGHEGQQVSDLYSQFSKNYQSQNHQVEGSAQQQAKDLQLHMKPAGQLRPPTQVEHISNQPQQDSQNHFMGMASDPQRQYYQHQQAQLQDQRQGQLSQEQQLSQPGHLTQQQQPPNSSIPNATGQSHGDQLSHQQQHESSKQLQATGYLPQQSAFQSSGSAAQTQVDFGMQGQNWQQQPQQNLQSIMPSESNQNSRIESQSNAQALSMLGQGGQGSNGQANLTNHAAARGDDTEQEESSQDKGEGVQSGVTDLQGQQPQGFNAMQMMHNMQQSRPGHQDMSRGGVHQQPQLDVKIEHQQVEQFRQPFSFVPPQSQSQPMGLTGQESSGLGFAQPQQVKPPHVISQPGMDPQQMVGMNQTAQMHRGIEDSQANSAAMPGFVNDFYGLSESMEGLAGKFKTTNVKELDKETPKLEQKQGAPQNMILNPEQHSYAPPAKLNTMQPTSAPPEPMHQHALYSQQNQAQLGELKDSKLTEPHFNAQQYSHAMNQQNQEIQYGPNGQQLPIIRKIPFVSQTQITFGQNMGNDGLMAGPMSQNPNEQGQYDLHDHNGIGRPSSD